MLTADIIKTALEILFAAALLAGVWNREKLIAFERKIADAFDYEVEKIMARRAEK